MTRHAPALPVLVPVLALALSCPGQQPATDADVALEVTASETDVELGVAFPLTVVRTWSSDLLPEEWSDEVLAPLVVRPLDVRRKLEGGTVEETRTYRAYAFDAGELTVPAPWFRARPAQGGTDRIAFADDLHLRVASALGSAEGDGGVEVEPPPGPLPAPFPWTRLLLLVLPVALAIHFFAARVRRRVALRPPAPALPPLPAHTRALQRLAELRERSPTGRDELRADSVEASSLVREYVEERFSVSAPDMTTDEFLAHPATASRLAPAHRALLSDYLAHCDMVKFARHRPEPGERVRQLDAAEAFLRETGSNGTARQRSDEDGRR